MATIVIEISEQGGGTVSVDNGEPAPFRDIREVCEVLMSMGTEPSAEESAAFDAAATPEQPMSPMGGRM